MSTKLRSACDKCHETKVRCSGDIPCQGCLISRSLCFYSVSNPLGRPRGTKKKQNRGGSRGNNTWDKDGVSNGDATATTAGTTGDRGLRKRTRTRQALTGPKDNNDDCSGSVSWNPVVSNGHREDTSDLLGSGGPAPGDNSSFIPTHHGHNNVGMSDVAAPNDFRLNSLNLADNGTQGLGDTLPHNFGYSDLDTYGMSDVARSDFGSLTNSDTRNPITWDSSTYNIDSENSSDLLRTSAENLDSSNTSNVKKNPFQKICICVWLCVVLIALTTKPLTPTH
jgi:Fungal Zn(2)-Cys(6) binuclear cluster domain